MNQSIGYLLWDVTRLMRQQFQNDPRLSCITLSQAKALTQIYYHEGIKQVELAEMLEIKPMTLVRVIDSLVEEELIERRPDPNDRRAHRIYLQPKAEEQLKLVRLISQDVWSSALAGLPDEDIEQFIRTLKHIHHNVSHT
ncbi:MarR family winged helix-turn-helix transcriptional regulator [Vibrio mangrovi]|uniref:MarR family transcriptional regulator n=1 Tax=Vibrio mangrovi TaxID=474394 RepID=A0A1Y6IQW8_9VIBR|nr:MarR family transcriptional regulator [Vibrio mangrovi]MDW6003755.1 MarR family transcriptional regulator [Vibrio mangrovi]SMR99451.1 Transcriptional regulator SlyA [Vibrio mangrovi]